jgi:hypothetical protein
MVALQYIVAGTFDVVIEYSKRAKSPSPRMRATPRKSATGSQPDSKEDRAVVATVTFDGEKEKRKFQTKFEQVFHLKEKGFDESHITFAESAFSNLIGSVTYFHGSSSVKTLDGRPATTEAGPLITGVPSRSFFPRGFLWDEGFHQLLVSAWNIELSRTVVQHWLSRMDQNGWCVFVCVFVVVLFCWLLLLLGSRPDKSSFFFFFSYYGQDSKRTNFRCGSCEQSTRAVSFAKSRHCQPACNASDY